MEGQSKHAVKAKLKLLLILSNDIAEYDDRDEATMQAECRAQVWREIEWLRYESGRKPGWTALTFKELFDVWPERYMQTLTPVPAREVIEKWVRSRINAFKRGLKKNEAHGRAALSRGAAKAAGKSKPSGGDGTVERRPSKPYLACSRDDASDG